MRSACAVARGRQAQAAHPGSSAVRPAHAPPLRRGCCRARPPRLRACCCACFSEKGRLTVAESGSKKGSASGGTSSASGSSSHTCGSSRRAWAEAAPGMGQPQPVATGRLQHRSGDGRTVARTLTGLRTPYLLARRLNALQQLHEGLLAHGRGSCGLQRCGALRATPPPSGPALGRRWRQRSARCVYVPGLSACRRLCRRRCCSSCSMHGGRPLHVRPRAGVAVSLEAGLCPFGQPLPVSRALALMLLQLALCHRVPTLGVPGTHHALGAGALRQEAARGVRGACSTCEPMPA